MRLDDEDVYDWWVNIQSIRKINNDPVTEIKHSKVFQWDRIFVQEIPNETCYNYLATRGYTCNNHGEILLDWQDFLQYSELFETFIKTEET